MATRLYLHDAASAISGTLPSTEQSSRTAAVSIDAQTINRSMNTTIGTAQVVKSATSANATDRIYYITKFVSDNLNQTSIAANTWTYNFAFKIANVSNQICPVFSTGGNEFNHLPITVYVWRPSTGAKVSNILDANSGVNTFHDCSWTSVNELVERGTFAGSAVTCQVNDVIIMEAWCYSSDSTARANAINYYYDGTTVNTTNQATVSNHASYLETPENIAFGAGGGAPIDMTQSAAKTYSNKFITKV